MIVFFLDVDLFDFLRLSNFNCNDCLEAKKHKKSTSKNSFVCLIIKMMEIY